MYLQISNHNLLHVSLTELKGIDIKPYTFSYFELKNATDDFNVDNKLGEGGFGLVFKVSALYNWRQ